MDNKIIKFPEIKKDNTGLGGLSSIDYIVKSPYTITYDPPLDPTTNCLNAKFDRDNPDQVGKPRMLSCPCPLCSPRC